MRASFIPYHNRKLGSWFYSIVFFQIFVGTPFYIWFITFIGPKWLNLWKFIHLIWLFVLSRHGLFDIWQKRYSLLSVKLNRHSESWLISIYFPCSMWCGKFSSNFFFQFDVSCFILKVANFHLKTECSFGTLLFWCLFGVVVRLRSKRTLCIRLMTASQIWQSVKFALI